MKYLIPVVCLALVVGCNNPASRKSSNEQTMDQTFQPGSFGYDLEFLSKHKKTIVLQRGEAMLAIVPDYQGRVMTSTASGKAGPSFGWINYGLIQTGQPAPHFSNFGGEERFWLGPEGGQFGIYFPPGKPFDFDNWQVPAPIDYEPFDLVSADDTMAIFTKDIQLTNNSQFSFSLRANRSVRMLQPDQFLARTGIALPESTKSVVYESVNKITNTGKLAWTQSSGLLSIWMLGQLICSPSNIILVPYVAGPASELGPVVNDAYFGKVPADRLKITDNLILFKADGLQRGKIGLSPSRARNYLGSYDYEQNILTLQFFTKPDHHNGYVNSMWELQDDPYAGDVINAYNDGPLEDGSQMGPFYELEASSPAAALKPGEHLEHTNLTIHISGQVEDLNKLLQTLFGISAEEVRTAFN
ncbi:MAG: hypothetical protein M0P69_05855 [Bacteroidales bacterium]|jgi:hypothetical protein|nr:hypothetical protein [Bacteroidales bacterium]MDD3385609.1 hypothetical protein [Bacteroidales bacterium]